MQATLAAAQMAAIVHSAEEMEARRAAIRGASRATIERNTYRHAYTCPAPSHQDDKCTICLTVFEVDSDCRYYIFQGAINTMDATLTLKLFSIKHS